MAKQLLGNFNAFRDPKNPGFISVGSIHAMASRGWSPNPAENENICLAKELLRRPDLMSALDRHSSTGSLDGLIDRQNLHLVINGGNYFKYNTDKELAGEMLKHFNALKGGPWGQDINIEDLRQLAAKRPTGDAAKDHLIQLAQEVLKRSDLVTKLDNLASSHNDGRISKEALRQLSR